MSRLSLPLALLVGCAHAPSVSGERVAQLPPESQQQILHTHQAIDVANQNVANARVALDEAEKLRAIAARELDGAKANDQAARAGIDLGRQTRKGVTEAQERYDLTLRQLFASRAKLDYADRVVELRNAEVNQRRAELSLARADSELVKFNQLQSAGITGDLRQSDFDGARLNAQNDLARARIQVGDLNGRVEQLRTAWMQRASEFQTASRGRDLQVPTVNPPPISAPNEGPSAPQSVPQPLPQD